MSSSSRYKLSGEIKRVLTLLHLIRAAEQGPTATSPKRVLQKTCHHWVDEASTRPSTEAQDKRYCRLQNDLSNPAYLHSKLILKIGGPVRIERCVWMGFLIRKQRQVIQKHKR